MKKRDKLQIEEKIQALQEELAGFLPQQVIPTNGEFPYIRHGRG